MQKKYYIDGIQQVHFIGGMVRMDMYQLVPQANAEPSQEGVGQLIMTPQGFISALGAMQQLAERLVEAGILEKTK